MQETIWYPFSCNVQRQPRQMIIQIGSVFAFEEKSASQGTFHQPVVLPLETWEYICEACQHGQLPPLMTHQQRTCLLVLAESLHESNHDQQALELLAHINQDHPLHLVAQFLRANLCFSLGRNTSNRAFFNEADALYRETLALLEQIKASPLVLAALHVKRGKTLEELLLLQDALAAYQHAVATAPTDASVWMSLSQYWLFRQHNLREALNCALQANQLDPTNSEIQHDCAKLQGALLQRQASE